MSTSTSFDVARAYTTRVMGLKGADLKEEWGKEVKQEGTGG